jgi:hypothetical protein
MERSQLCGHAHCLMKVCTIVFTPGWVCLAKIWWY